MPAEDSTPLVTLIVTPLGDPKELRRLLNSIMEQTYTNLDIVCIDCGVDEERRACLKQLCARDRRIRVIHTLSTSSPEIHNIGLHHAMGKWIAFVGTNQELSHGFIREALNLATDDHSQMMCYGWGELGVNLYSKDLLRNANLAFDETLAWGDITFSHLAMAYAGHTGVFPRDEPFTRFNPQATLRTLLADDPLAITRELSSLKNALVRSCLWEKSARLYQEAALTWLARSIKATTESHVLRVLGQWLSRGGWDALGLPRTRDSSCETSRSWDAVTQLMDRATETDQTLVSIIVPVFNRIDYLCQSIDTIRAQSHQLLDIILVDDGSDDPVPEMLNHYAAVDSRIVIVRQQSRGAAAARNAGFSIALGDYCMFLDSDDWFDESLVEEMLWSALTVRSQIVVCEAASWSNKEQRVLFHYKPRVPVGFDNQTLSASKNPAEIFSFCETAVWIKLYSVDFVRYSGVRFQEIPSSNDVYFNLLTLALADSISIVPFCLVTYRRDTGDSIQDRRTRQDSTNWICALRAAREELMKRDLFPLLKQSFREYVFRQAEYNLRTLPDPIGRKQLWTICRRVSFKRLVGTCAPLGIRIPRLRRFAWILRNGSYNDLVAWFDAGRPYTGRWRVADAPLASWNPNHTSHTRTTDRAVPFSVPSPVPAPCAHDAIQEVARLESSVFDRKISLRQKRSTLTQIDSIVSTLGHTYRHSDASERESIRGELANANLALANVSFSATTDGIVFAYNWSPFADVSAYVATRRLDDIAALGNMTVSWKVVSANMSNIRSKDPLYEMFYANRKINEHTILSGPAYFSEMAQHRWAEAAFKAMKKTNAGVLYSRSMFAGSHEAAYTYKKEHPEAVWYAEFSDPVAFDVTGNLRNTVGHYEGEYEWLNSYWWQIEEWVYSLADVILFNNPLQAKFMLSHHGGASALRAESHFTILPHPVMEAKWTDVVPAAYDLEPNHVNIGYFGSFYETRSPTDLWSLVDDPRVCLHLFGPGMTDLNPPHPERVRLNPPVDYLRFLAIASTMDFLVISDVQYPESVNPYLPSKLSDYLAVKVPIVALVDDGSALSQIDQPMVLYRTEFDSYLQSGKLPKSG